MVDICPVCGLPKDLCACDTLAREKQTILVKTAKKRYGKLVTVIKGISSSKDELNRVAKELKTKLACGGTVKDDEVELQGDHKSKVKKILSGLGYEENQIEIR